MNKKLFAIMATVVVTIQVPTYADVIFDRIVEIDAQVDQLLAERDGLIASKTQVVSPSNYQTVYTSGQYKIGKDIPAGEYVFFNTGYSGSIKETTDSNGSDKVYSEYFSYNLIYTLTEGNYIEISDAYAVPSDEVTTITKNTGDGMFKIGVHLDPGEYKLVGTNYEYGGSYKIFNSSVLNDKDSKIKSDYFDKLTYVTVHDGEYLMISGALFVE